MTARPMMTPSAVPRKAASRRAGQEDQEAELQRALAAVAVAERAGGEQQAGEHERVGVDHPLQLRAGGVELAGQGGQGHVQAGVADDDDHQARAQHGQGPPPPPVDVLVDLDALHLWRCRHGSPFGPRRAKVATSVRERQRCHRAHAGASRVDARSAGVAVAELPGREQQEGATGEHAPGRGAAAASEAPGRRQVLTRRRRPLTVAGGRRVVVRRGGRLGRVGGAVVVGTCCSIVSVAVANAGSSGVLHLGGGRG